MLGHVWSQYELLKPPPPGTTVHRPAAHEYLRHERETPSNSRRQFIVRDEFSSFSFILYIIYISASRMVWILDRDDTQLDEGVAVMVMVMVMVEVAKVVTVDWAVVAYVPVLPKHARVSSRD